MSPRGATGARPRPARRRAHRPRRIPQAECPRMKLLVAFASALVLGLLTPAVPAGAARAPAAEATSLVIGAKNFSGAQILSQVYGQGLEARGRTITFKTDLGPTEVVFAALQR